MVVGAQVLLRVKSVSGFLERVRSASGSFVRVSSPGIFSFVRTADSATARRELLAEVRRAIAERWPAPRAAA